eukprot:scaffold48_cov311-Pinguiococcus_pyrenoidosus.AAC.321
MRRLEEVFRVAQAARRLHHSIRRARQRAALDHDVGRLFGPHRGVLAAVQPCPGLSGRERRTGAHAADRVAQNMGFRPKLRRKLRSPPAQNPSSTSQ